MGAVDDVGNRKKGTTFDRGAGGSNRRLPRASSRRYDTQAATSSPLAAHAPTSSRSAKSRLRPPWRAALRFPRGAPAPGREPPRVTPPHHQGPTLYLLSTSPAEQPPHAGPPADAAGSAPRYTNRSPRTGCACCPPTPSPSRPSLRSRRHRRGTAKMALRARLILGERQQLFQVPAPIAGPAPPRRPRHQAAIVPPPHRRRRHPQQFARCLYPYRRHVTMISMSAILCKAFMSTTEDFCPRSYSRHRLPAGRSRPATDASRSPGRSSGRAEQVDGRTGCGARTPADRRDPTRLAWPADCRLAPTNNQHTPSRPPSGRALGTPPPPARSPLRFSPQCPPSRPAPGAQRRADAYRPPAHRHQSNLVVSPASLVVCSEATPAAPTT